MFEVFPHESGYGFQIGSIVQTFKPFAEGFLPMTEAEATQIAECFDSPAGPHWTGDEVVKRIQISSDRQQVTADGVDVAVITAVIDDAEDTTPIEFAVDGADPVEVIPTDGEASLEITFEAGNAGTKRVTVSHSRFGVNEVILEVVEA